MTFTSSDTTVATIDNNGNIILTGINGYTQIKATFAGNESYDGKEVSYLINVQKTTLSDSQFGLKSNSSEITLAETTTIAIGDIINNEFDLPITIISSNTNIVTIGENNQITINTSNNGTSILTITYDGLGNYAKKSLQYTITVNISGNAAALTGMIKFNGTTPVIDDKLKNSITTDDITITGGGTQSNISLTYNNTTFTTGLKMNNTPKVEIDIPSTCNIELIMYYSKTDDLLNPKINGKLNSSYEKITETDKYYKLKLNNINKNLVIEKGDKEYGLIALIFS